MKKGILFVLILMIIGGVWLAVSKIMKINTEAPATGLSSSSTPITSKAPVNKKADEVKPAGTQIAPPTTQGYTTSATIVAPSEKLFTVTGNNFSFSPSSISVKKGDKVKITFKNAEGFHDFRIDAFNVATEKIQGGAGQTVEFVADKAGSFEYYCSVGTHRAMGMKGVLVVN